MSNASKLVQDIQELVDHAIARVEDGSTIQPRLLDVDDSGRYLGMSDKSVRELIMNGELPFIQKVPARSPYLLDRFDLDKWIEKNKRLAGE